MFSTRVPILPILFVATMINASVLTACVPERGTKEANLFASEAPTSTESNQGLSDCVGIFPDLIIDEQVNIGNWTYFIINDDQRTMPFRDECPGFSTPEVSDNEISEPIIYMETSHLADILVFPFDLPTWAPDGYELQNDAFIWEKGLDEYEAAVESGDPPPGIGFNTSWLHPSRDPISTSVVFRGGPPSGWILTGSLKEVEVNSRPAALIRGEWVLAKDGLEWVDDKLTLILDVGGNLRYGFTTKEDSVTAEELIRMAESMEPFP